MTDLLSRKRTAHASANASLSYVLGMALNGVHLPLRHDFKECGTIVDAEGEMIMVVDMHHERPDDQVMAIAELIVLAVNSHAGFGGDSANA